jgi:glycosyltransferase involved in cell wall biosynthesis
MNILFLVPYPQGEAPSQRFRFEQYFDKLEEEGIAYTVLPFLDEQTWHILYKPGQQFNKARGIIKGFVRRIKMLSTVSKYDFVFIHREASPIGPPIFEWIIAKLLKKRIIYDFDDAIWIPNTSESNRIAAKLKWHHKVADICKWSYKISCGNGFLKSYALNFNANAIYNPTTLDTEKLHNPNINAKYSNPKPVIGWTGTHSTLKYLMPIVPVLQKLEQEINFEFCVIANKNPELPLKSFRFILWNKETEISDLQRFDVGLMPLTDDRWSNGKCGFKALQYMSLGIPALVSPVGVNADIVDHAINGYVCRNEQEWYESLREVLINPLQNKKLGDKARQKVVEFYSTQANCDNFLALFTLA